MTPHELNICLESFGEKEKLKAESDLLNAYLTAYFHRVDKLESFEYYKKKMDQEVKQSKVMSDDEMLEMVMKLNGMFGGETN